MTSWQIIAGDCRERLRDIPEQSVQACITSPPYFGLRDYGHDGQLGLEPTVEEYVERLVEVFREVRRVLRDDGTLWLNLGDSYAGSWGAQSRGETSALADRSVSAQQIVAHPKGGTHTGSLVRTPGLKPKDLIGVPWRVAFALQTDGWWLREDVIWAKPNPMPESVRDRCTRAHEYVFRLTKSARYFADMDAVREAASHLGPNGAQKSPHAQGFGRRTPEQEQQRRTKRRTVRPGIDVNGGGQGSGEMGYDELSRNKRSVWTVPTKPYPEAHFATFPPQLVEPMVLCASRPDDTVLDPFAGAGTVALPSLRHGRSFIGIELNPDYCELARERIRNDQPLFNTHSEVAA